VVDVTNRSDVAVRLRPFKLLFGHGTLRSSSLVTVSSS
jgi:hypothetical protein